jgi:hypothetical protein
MTTQAETVTLSVNLGHVARSDASVHRTVLASLPALSSLYPTPHA